MRNRRILRIGIVALALIVELVAWLATRGDDGDTAPAAYGGPVSVPLTEATSLCGQRWDWIEAAG